MHADNRAADPTAGCFSLLAPIEMFWSEVPSVRGTTETASHPMRPSMRTGSMSNSSAISCSSWIESTAT